MNRLKIWWAKRQIHKIRRRAALRAIVAGNPSIHRDELVRAGIRDEEIIKVARLRVKVSRLEQD